MFSKRLVAAVLAAASIFLLLPLTEGHEIIDIHGSGTTNPSYCYWYVMETIQAQAYLPVRLTYRAIGSTAGQQEFFNNYQVNESLADFGSGDIPISTVDYNKLQAAGVDIIHLPVLVVAVTFFYNLPATVGLNMTACLLARILTRNLTVWDDPDILAINPNLDLTGATRDITVVRRDDGSSSTASVTGYLNLACNDTFPDNMVGAQIDTWPADTVAEEGSAGVTQGVQEIFGSIGYIEAGHGLAAGLPEIRLQNRDGNFVTSDAVKTINETIFQSILPGNATDDFGSVSFLDLPGATTWPIVLMTYIYVRKDISYIDSPEQQALLVAFLKAMYDETYVGKCRDQFGFILPTDSIAEYGREGIQILQDFINSSQNTSQPFYFEESTEAGAGAGEYVISVKRQQISDIELGSLLTVPDDLTTLSSVVDKAVVNLTAATALIAELQAKVLALEGGDVTATADSGFDSDKERQLKAATVLASMSFGFWVLFFIFQAAKFLVKK